MNDLDVHGLLNMELHSHVNLIGGQLHIIRVPGGWLYTTYWEGETDLMTTTFVPIPASDAEHYK